MKRRRETQAKKSLELVAVLVGIRALQHSIRRKTRDRQDVQADERKARHTMGNGGRRRSGMTDEVNTDNSGWTPRVCACCICPEWHLRADPTKEWKFDKPNKLLQAWNYTHRCHCMLRHSLRDSDYLKKARKGEDYWERNVEERKVVNESKLRISLQSIKSTWCSIQAAILMSNMMMLSVSPLLSSYLLSIHSLNFHELSILRECPKQFRAIINGRGIYLFEEAFGEALW